MAKKRSKKAPHRRPAKAPRRRPAKAPRRRPAKAPRKKQAGAYTRTMYKDKKTGKFVSAARAKRLGKKRVSAKRIYQSKLTGRYMAKSQIRKQVKAQYLQELVKGTPKQIAARREGLNLLTIATKEDLKDMMEDSPTLESYIEWLVDHLPEEILEDYEFEDALTEYQAEV